MTSYASGSVVIRNSTVRFDELWTADTCPQISNSSRVSLFRGLNGSCSSLTIRDYSQLFVRGGGTSFVEPGLVVESHALLDIAANGPVVMKRDLVSMGETRLTNGTVAFGANVRASGGFLWSLVGAAVC